MRASLHRSRVHTATLSIDIDARPEHIWPWLVQMGYQRGGLYSYDWLDRLFGYLDRPSARRLLPEHQQLRVGDVIPIGRGRGFPVQSIDPYRSLVLGGREPGVEWSWEFALEPIGRERTRLTSQSRLQIPAGLRWRLFLWVLRPAAFIMTRQMLRGLEQRSEALARATRATRATRAA